MTKSQISKHKSKRLWSKMKLLRLEHEAGMAALHNEFRRVVDDMMNEGDLHELLEYLEPWADGNDGRYHWPLVQVGVCHMLLDDQDKALKFITDVLYHYDDCQYTQFYFARILSLRGQWDDAIEIFERAVKRGAAKIARAKCDCCEGLEWAENLVADCKCSLGVAYSHVGRNKKSEYWYRRYEEDRRRGRTGLLVWWDYES